MTIRCSVLASLNGITCYETSPKCKSVRHSDSVRHFCSMMLSNHVVPTWHIFTQYNTNAQTWSHSAHSHQATLLLPFKTGPDCATTLCVSNTRSFQRQHHGSLETLQNTHQLFTNYELQRDVFWRGWLYMRIYSSSKRILKNI